MKRMMIYCFIIGVLLRFVSGLSLINEEPLYFVANKGQWDSKVKFMARINGATYWFMNDGYICQTPIENCFDNNDDGKADLFPGSNRLNCPEILSIRWKLENCSPYVQIKGLDSLPHYSNYFIGKNPEKWCTGVPHFKKIFYSDIYSGIDLQFYFSANTIKYDFVVKPEAKPEDIRIRYIGSGRITLSQDGKLITISNGNLHNEYGLVVYQVKDGKMVNINGRYKIFDDNSIGFDIGVYDKDFSLVIDPFVSIVYSTYLGGSSYESGNDVTVDTLGCAYVTGYTMSTNFPLQNPYQGNNAGSFDVFVSKFSQIGNQLLYSTYLGGTSEDVAYGIAIDGMGNIYLTGRTSSTDFPVVNYYQQYNAGGLYDAFVTKISANGTQLSFSTYLGGSGSDEAMDIVVDTSRYIYIVGKTTSNNFPLRNPFQPSYGGGYVDGFLTKFLPSGNQLVFSTFLGGSGLDEAWDMALDNSNNIYVAGYTSSFDFPTQNPFQSNNAGENDGFITKFAASGSALIYSTYFGGELYDYCNGICVDRFGYAYITGGTESDNFPIYNPYQNIHYGVDAFVSKLGINGNNLIFSTFLGGTSYEYGTDIAVDSHQCVYVTGYTGSGNFPLRNPFQASYGGGYYDGFVTKFTFAGNQLSYSSYLGGNSDDVSNAIVVDRSGSAYITGNTLSSNFPVVNPFQGTRNGPADGFLTKLSVDNTGNFELPRKRISINFDILPSVVSEMLSFKITTTEFQRLEISVFDINGRKIADIYSRNVSPGSTAISYNTDGLPAGIYFMKINCGQECLKIHKFIKINRP